MAASSIIIKTLLVSICTVTLSLSGCNNKPKEKDDSNGNTIPPIDNTNNHNVTNPPLETVKLEPPPALSKKTAKLPKGTEIAVIELGEMGNIELQLFPEDAPANVANFEKMVGYGLYDGLSFNRSYVYAFIAAGNPDEKGILIYDRLQPEPNKRLCKRGSICMTRLILEDKELATQASTDNSEESRKAEKKKTTSDKTKSSDKKKTQPVHYGEVSPSEFFIVLDDTNGKFWNDDFCVFASVITGIDLADKVSEMIDWKHRPRKKTTKTKEAELKSEIKINRVTIQWVGNTKPPILGNPHTMPNYGAIPTI